jgi:membrane carboxypeptidase/penicillin-binding protein PbpC
MGNADGAGSRSLVGGEAAAPLALRILAAVDAGAPVAPPPALVLPTSPPSVERPSRSALTIVSPVSRSDIVDDPETPSARRRVPLRARLTGDDIPGGELLWFVDGTPVGAAAPGEPAWWQPSTGEHEVRVVGATGLSDRVTIRVRPPSPSD